ALHQRTDVTYDGLPLLVEDLSIGPGLGRSGILGGARVLDTVSVLGCRAPGTPDPPVCSHRLELDGPGTVVRALGTHAHDVSLAGVWTAVAGPHEAPVAATA
ncbi:MAG: urease accessory protein UreD, partial [Actinomycetota bacterium]|nr:urease accessory protein UreD [Actinomycetota bacterium]